MMTSQWSNATAGTECCDAIKDSRASPSNYSSRADVINAEPTPELSLSLWPERKHAVTMKPSGACVNK